MGFGLPWMLLGLVAVAAPILAHLLRRQRLPRQTLPTIAFLHRIHATRAARLRVVDMLLLLLRVLLVLIVVLVAAQPYRVVQSSVTDRQHALARQCRTGRKCAIKNCCCETLFRIGARFLRR